MVKEVSKSSVIVYIKKAEEFYAIALEALENKRYDAATFNATQAVILANDALCINFLGRRPSKDHREAVNLHLQVGKQIADTSKRQTVISIFDERSESGYTERMIKPFEARKSVIQAKQFIEWAKEKIG